MIELKEVNGKVEMIRTFIDGTKTIKTLDSTKLEINIDSQYVFIRPHNEDVGHTFHKWLKEEGFSG